MKSIFNLDKLSTPQQVLLVDPISNATRIARRNLLFSAVVVLIAISYGSGSIKIPFFNLPATPLLGALSCVVLYNFISFISYYTTDVQRWHLLERITLNEDCLNSLKHLSERMSEVDSEFLRLQSFMRSHETVYKEEVSKFREPIEQLVEKHSKCDEINGLIKALDVIDISIHDCINPAFTGQNNQIKDARSGKYSDEFKRMISVIEYLADDSKHYRKIYNIARRESLQLRIWQYIKIYFWEGLLPIFIASASIIGTYHVMVEFIISVWGSVY